MQAHRYHGTISVDHTLTLENLPFEEGEEVEIIVLAEARKARSSMQYPLRGLPVTYRQPTEPVAESDWTSET